MVNLEGNIVIEITLDIIFVSFFSGFGAMILDSYWEKKGNKESKKLEFFEHYHNSIILFIIAMFTFSTSPMITAALISVALVFLVGEWRQIHYTKDNNVLPGHPFAYGSVHFKASSIMGITLICIAIFTYFLIQIIAG